MRHRSLLLATTVVTVAALGLSACGSRDAADDSAGGDGSTVVIGVDAPLTGDLSAMGQGIKNSADLAARVANRTKEVKGVTFKVKALDDAGQAGTGQQNATRFVGDEDVYGVVGPLNSHVGESVQKVLANADLVQVSPANTAPSLTMGPKWRSGEKSRPFDSYFRTCATDDAQGPFAARYVHQKGLTKAYVIDDKRTYGAGLARSFRREFEKLGGTVVATEHVNPEDRDFSAITTKVRNSGAQFVYFGGEYPAGAPFTDQLARTGADIPVVGGDALYSAEYIALAKKHAEGALVTSIGAPLETLRSAKEFMRNYRKAGYELPWEAFGGYAYDSAWAVVQAVKAVVAKNDGRLPEDLDEARAQISAAMQHVSFDGVTGQVSFDKFGDTTNQQMTVYEVTDGEFEPVHSGSVKG